MNYINFEKILMAPEEPPRHNVLWLDVSNLDDIVLKVYYNHQWYPVAWDGARGEPGHSPLLSGKKENNITYIYADGIEIGAIRDANSFISKEAVEAVLKGNITSHTHNSKQDVISDLEDIRSGAVNGATALARLNTLGGTVYYGYLDSGTFYEDEELLHPITPNEKDLYINFFDGNPYHAFSDGEGGYIYSALNANNISVAHVQYEDEMGEYFDRVMEGAFAIVSIQDGNTYHTILPTSNGTVGWLLQSAKAWAIADDFSEEGFDEETTWAALVSWLSEHSTAIKSNAATPYISLERLRKYLYRVTFDSLPEDNNLDDSLGGACSSFVQNGKLYRNLDFKYDNAASFIIRTKDFEGMSFLTGLNDGTLSDTLISQLPFHVVDGRNNNGIMVSTHVLFNDWNYTGCGNKSIPLTKLPFLVLTNVKSMATIADDLNDVLENVKVTEGMGDYLLQVLVTDGTTTYVIIPPEADNFDYVLVDASSNPKLTNFRWLSSSTVARDDADMQDRPTGIERYNMMPCDLVDLQFTLCYESANRLSEFIGINGTDKDSTDAELTAIYDSARQEYLSRERDGATWQTMHSVVYGSKMESLFIQEDWTDNCVNAGNDSIEGVVKYSEAQSLTNTQKLQARTNIDAADAADVTELGQSLLNVVGVREISQDTLTQLRSRFPSVIRVNFWRTSHDIPRRITILPSLNYNNWIFQNGGEWFVSGDFSDRLDEITTWNELLDVLFDTATKLVTNLPINKQLVFNSDGTVTWTTV